MLFRILADIVVLLHLLWILFLIFGAVWGGRNKTIKIVHLSGLSFAILIQVFDWYCPLTHLEIWLRSKHDPFQTYAGSFIIHYVENLVYLEVSETTIIVFTILLCMFSLWLYWRRRRPNKGK